MNWLLNTYVFAVAALLLLCPGVLIASCARVRGLALWASAGPLSITFVSCTAVALSLLGIPFSLLSVTGALVLVSALVWLIVRGRASNSMRRGPAAWALPLPTVTARWVYLGLALAFMIIVWRLLSIFGHPDAFSQTFDDVFHLNAVRFIQDSGSGSSLTVGLLVNPGQTISFYPSAWHDFAALVSTTTGASIPAAVNAVNVVIAAIIWPAGLMFMVTRMTGLQAVPVLLTGVLSAGFTAFPYLMLDFGVLYPYLLAVALLPFAIGLAFTFTESRVLLTRANISAAALLVMALPGMALAHPSSLLALTAFTFPSILLVFTRSIKSALGRKRRARALIPPLAWFVGYLVVAVLGWKILRPDPASAVWGPYQSLSQSLGEGLLSAPMSRPVPWVIAIMTVCGVAILLRRRETWWILGVMTIGLGLFSMASGMRPGGLRSFVTGGWYNDSNRLAALLPIAVIGVAVVGGTWVFDRVILHTRRIISERRIHSTSLHSATRAGAIVSGTIVLALITQFGSVGFEVRSAAAQFQITDTSNLISTDEKALLDRIDTMVPAGATLVASPWTGASLVYALAGRRSLTPHIFGDPGPEAQFVLDHLSNLSTDPAVCDAIEETHTFYVLDFGTQEVHGGSHPFPGVKHLATVPGIRLIDSEGEAKLYQITGCR
ncbi:DUF6541 family protein [Arthrobacter cryoconiti]|uniref:DUF6541 family protein n=1 Tax=Arthrobacter cryoconiti TaxID=748907 RepID=A0ABV8QX63_9MICC|nr:DUF6541 family protein [Arthrobacter cryoconiti]MCC9069024.1 hypothetical protein [Arthrobacter cryoconiti]